MSVAIKPVQVHVPVSQEKLSRLDCALINETLRPPENNIE